MSTWYTVHLSQDSTDELRESKEEIIGCIEIEADSLMQKKQCILEEVQILNKKVDTVNHNIRRIRRSDCKYSSSEREMNKKQ